MPSVEGLKNIRFNVSVMDITIQAQLETSKRYTFQGNILFKIKL